jgi:hypothetical protein
VQKYEQFAKNMAGLGELFNKEISPSLMELYWQILDNLTDTQFEKACQEAARKRRFFPKPAELLELIEQDPASLALAAWDKLTQAIRDYGQYRSIEFDDPALTATVESMGGWVTACLWRADDLPHRRREFLSTYQVMSQRAFLERRTLPGLHDGEPVRIGAQPARLRLVN